MKSTKVQTLGAYRTASPEPAGVYEYACAKIGHASRSSSCVCACAYIVKRDHRLGVDCQSVVQHGLAASVGTVWGRAGGS